MTTPYEEHVKQIIAACPTIGELLSPSASQRKALWKIREHCLLWCIQEWEYSFKLARQQLETEACNCENGTITCLKHAGKA